MFFVGFDYHLHKLVANHVFLSEVDEFDTIQIGEHAFGLREILAWFETKYAGAPYNRVHLLKALTYFADAESEPMPDMPDIPPVP